MTSNVINFYEKIENYLSDDELREMSIRLLNKSNRSKQLLSQIVDSSGKCSRIQTELKYLNSQLETIEHSLKSETRNRDLLKLSDQLDKMIQSSTLELSTEIEYCNQLISSMLEIL